MIGPPPHILQRRVCSSIFLSTLKDASAYTNPPRPIPATTPHVVISLMQGSITTGTTGLQSIRAHKISFKQLSTTKLCRPDASSIFFTYSLVRHIANTSHRCIALASAKSRKPCTSPLVSSTHVFHPRRFMPFERRITLW
jgi:hypothetical protein